MPNSPDRHLTWSPNEALPFHSDHDLRFFLQQLPEPNPENVHLFAYEAGMGKFRLAITWDDMYSGKSRSTMPSPIALAWTKHILLQNPNLLFMDKEGGAAPDNRPQPGGSLKIPAIESLSWPVSVGFLSHQEPFNNTTLEFVKLVAKSTARHFHPANAPAKEQIMNRLMGFQKENLSSEAYDIPQVWFFDAILFSNLSREFSRLNKVDEARQLADRALQIYQKSIQTEGYIRMEEQIKSMPSLMQELQAEIDTIGKTDNQEEKNRINRKSRDLMETRKKLERFRGDQVYTLINLAQALARTGQREAALALIPEDQRSAGVIFSLIDVPDFEALAVTQAMTEMEIISGLQNNPRMKLELWYAAAKFVADAGKLN